MFRDLLLKVSEYLPRRVIVGGDGEAYLSRFKVCDFGRDNFRVFLHQFHRGDEDRELHNHPWAWCWSLILHGYYEEERLVAPSYDRTGTLLNYYVKRTTFGRGDINRIYPNTFHRVSLPNGEAWSIIISGPLVQRWGFLDTTTGEYKDYRVFLKEKGVLEDDDGSPKFGSPRRKPLSELAFWITNKLEGAREHRWT